MIVHCGRDFIYYVEFKRIKFLIDNNMYVFLGNLKNNCIEYSDAHINFKLLNKFKLNFWDENSNKMVPHIKFLVKYSPILSKFINFEEFNSIEIQKKDHKSINWEEVYYIEFNNGLKFFNTEEIDFYTKTLYAYIDPKFSQILKSFEK